MSTSELNTFLPLDDGAEEVEDEDGDEDEDDAGELAAGVDAAGVLLESSGFWPLTFLKILLTVLE